MCALTIAAMLMICSHPGPLAGSTPSPPPVTMDAWNVWSRPAGPPPVPPAIVKHDR